MSEQTPKVESLLRVVASEELEKKIDEELKSEQPEKSVAELLVCQKGQCHCGK